ncbi:BT_3987 domain-containing protein [Parabacteroides sp. AM08-6]|uniref:BT_3987 domain-containing protein n=1 Tax=Parabacteroides sp. AM08-6 TaxID=2292053 RepID=UPI000EFFE4FF|nr:DUF1735 domain-containing protein [Parabacteroides sp. AM08-6]RHJ83946.1 DUF1735 domain-containing protein [Parabacteroides sp. AM08-6]
MKTKLILAAGALIMLGACDESEYELENLVPEGYHKVMYINNSGEQDLTLYNTGEDNIYKLSVFKGGSEPGLTANAKMGVLSQETVDIDYSGPEGINYKVLGPECYSLDMTDLNFDSNERYKIVNVSIKVPNVEKAMENNPDATCVLPLYLYSETDSVNAYKNTTFIKIAEVLTPTVGFTTTDAVYLPFTYGFTDGSASINFGLDTDNNWDIDCQFEVDPDYLADFNAKNGTSILALPAANYSFEPTMVLPTGTTSIDLPVTLNSEGLQPGDYMLPIRLKDISLFEVSSKAVYPLIIRVTGIQMERSSWTVKANTEEKTGEGAGNGVATCLLDGDITSFWHSQWSGGSLALPHEIVVDTKKETTFTNFGLMQRQHSDYRDVRAGEFYVSSDNSTWTKVGEFTMEKILPVQIFPVTPTKGRYFKVVITASNRSGNSSLAELYAYSIN